MCLTLLSITKLVSKSHKNDFPKTFFKKTFFAKTFSLKLFEKPSIEHDELVNSKLQHRSNKWMNRLAEPYSSALRWPTLQVLI